MTSCRFIALLRGINVGGRNKLPMADLRSLCADLGWEDVRTYIQSGNVVFSAAGERGRLEEELAAAIERRLELAVQVIVRSASEWSTYVAGNPFPGASEREPNLVMLALSKVPPADDAVDRLRQRAEDGERVVRVGDALWIHFPSGSGRSKLAATDRVVGSPVTTRNWRTVVKLDEMVRSL